MTRIFKRTLAAALVLAVASSVGAQTLRIEEVDGDPRVDAWKLIVPNGSLTKAGSVGTLAFVGGTTDGAFLTGSGVPASSLGANGDAYLDAAAGSIYVKAAGSWGSAVWTDAIGTDDQTAAEVTIADAGELFTETTVEGALAEVKGLADAALPATSQAADVNPAGTDIALALSDKQAVLTGGTNGIDIDGTTLNFDTTEVFGSKTWGDGSTDTIVWTFNRATGTDPTLTIADGSFTFSSITATTLNATTFVPTTIELGHATDTTLSRTGAGAIAVEGVGVALNSTSLAHTAGTIELGAATDTTIARVGPGQISVEGVNVVTTSSTDTLTNKTIGAGVLTLAETATIGLDAAGSADEVWSGTSIPGTAGATLAVGDLVYLDVTAAEWLLADADAVGTAGSVCLGLCILAGGDGEATRILLNGTMRSAAFPASIALGAVLYVSTTAGDITATAPTGADDVVRVIGWAVTVEPNTIYFNPSSSWITHTGS